MHEKQGSAADEGAAEQFITDLEAGMFEQMLSVALPNDRSNRAAEGGPVD